MPKLQLKPTAGRVAYRPKPGAEVIVIRPGEVHDVPARIAKEHADKFQAAPKDAE